MKRRPLALLCWEAGRGRGHATALIAIAKRLQAHGWRSILAFPPDRLPPDLYVSGLSLYPAPVWGADTAPLGRQTTSTASFGDTLAQIGLQSPDWVRSQIRRWRVLFDRLQPHIVVADYAPGAVLAARGSIPTVVCGVGFVVPPAGLRRFPPLHHATPVVYDEDEVCASVNAALVDLAIRPLACLPEALMGAAQCVRTLPLLDPYDSERSEPPLGPLLNDRIEHRSADAREVFCYLREAPRSDRIDAIAACLGDIPGPVAAYVPGISEATRRYLQSRHVRLLDRPAALGEQLCNSRLVVHSGGHGMAAASLLAGVPQAILDFDIEKYLIAQALVRRGVAVRLDYYRATPDAIAEGLRRTLADPAQAAEAQRAATENDAYRHRDVALLIADTCRRLVEG